MEAELIKDDSGEFFGIAPNVTLSILPHQEGMDSQQVAIADPVMFHRNGIKWHMNGKPQEHVRWLVGELRGVRAYLTEGDDGKLNVILSDRDLQP